MRVISGKYGSRPLKAVTGMHTRPTTDKIKEAMFNLIGGGALDGAALDFYGGSGALGIEAVSRGADYAVICDNYGPAIKVIKQNILMTKEDHRFTLLTGDNHKRLQTWVDGRDLPIFKWVFLDPPYKQAQIVQDIQFLISLGCLDKQACLICETDKLTPLPEVIGTWQLRKDKVYGVSRIRIYDGGVWE